MYSDFEVIAYLVYWVQYTRDWRAMKNVLLEDPLNTNEVKLAGYLESEK